MLEISKTSELVITIPNNYGDEFAYQTRSRTTFGVLVQLLSDAKERIILASPFIHLYLENIFNSEITEAINAALQRGIKIDVLSTGSSFNTDDWQKINRDTSGNLRLFRPSANIIDDQKLGSHAKFCVMDGKSAYVGSANLTGPGLSSQLELGLLVHGEIANQIQGFWDYSIDIGLFVLV